MGSLVTNCSQVHFCTFIVADKTSMCLCVGRGGGAVQLSNGWVFGDWFARFIKAKDVFVSQTWKAMGRQVPPDH